MTTVGVTGASGFIGQNFCLALERTGAHTLRRIERTGPPLVEQVRGVEVVVHLAGVNRPAEEAEFFSGNSEYTERVCDALAHTETRPHILFASSIHAEASSPYGRSKRAAEEVLSRFVREAPGRSAIAYRLPNAFGKWGRPRYNSVVATFAHAIARGEPYEIHDPEKRIPLVYVDDIVAEFLRQCASPDRSEPFAFGKVEPVHEITLGVLARTFESFAASRQSNLLPSFDDPLTRKLFATYSASLKPDNLTYPLHERSDARGTLAEVIKSPDAGQIFVSVTRPGAIRGNHFHDSKIEKFLVLRGTAAIDMEDVRNHEHWRVTTSGERWEVIDIPPGVAHRITNVGQDDLVMLFWSSEVFDPQRPDTHSAKLANV